MKNNSHKLNRIFKNDSSYLRRSISSVTKLLRRNLKPEMGLIHANVHNYLQEKGIKLIDHPPYSPDLAPSDFWLFDEIKRRKTRSNNARESVYGRVTQILQSIPRNEYFKTVVRYIDRIRLCVTVEGDYFEHLIE